MLSFLGRTTMGFFTCDAKLAMHASDYQYSGKDPNRFMDKENIVKYLKKYSEFVKADILEGLGKTFN